MKKLSLTVLFITKNEEYHIGAAIDNVKDIAEAIYVVDSGSTDQTVAIAESKGAKVVYHKFEGFGAQWNFALSLPIKTDWTMKMDPDERLSDALKDELCIALQTTRADVGFSCDLVLWFMGHRLNGVKMEIFRIWRTGICRFTDISVNEHLTFVGRGHWQKLRGTMEHLDSRNLTDWLAKQNMYTLREAEQRLDGERLPARPRLFGSRLERRMFLKWLFRRLPFRYLIENLYNLFWRGAWRSGVHGWRWVKCRELATRIQEYKYFEMRDAASRVERLESTLPPNEKERQ